ncbi:hypothetical protein [Arthrobacter sp. NPDC093139]
MSALRAAGRQKSYPDITLHTTLAPCAMWTMMRDFQDKNPDLWAEDIAE